jgi:uncharacterized protein YdiU (UPF0061 family)
MSVRPSAAYLGLGEGFAEEVEPARFPLHEPRFLNRRWAERVGFEGMGTVEQIDRFGRFTPLPGSLEKPLALRYHGHQFRSYNPQIGDGRGFLYAQLHDPVDRRLLDLGTKGSGRTPFSRSGDGRLTLKGGVREILATEMLEALGVYTSKTFSLIETGESLTRGDEPSPTRSSVLVRLSHSHIRFGTFQKLGLFKERAHILRLVEWCVQHHHPDLTGEPHLPRAFFERVVERSAALAASWMAAGFVHGVLNTDNLNITGESFDYGPWRFLPHYDPAFTAAYFDESGLYAFGRQAEAVRWNLTRLGESLEVASPDLGFATALARFTPLYERALSLAFLARLGLASRDEDEDARLVTLLFAFLAESRAPFAQAFHDLVCGEASDARVAKSPSASFYRGERFDALREAMRAHTPVRPERLTLPYFERARPCDMTIGEVEAIFATIAHEDDWSALEWKVADIPRMGHALGLAPQAGTHVPLAYEST